jgi:hypothetical protein
VEQCGAVTSPEVTSPEMTSPEVASPEVAYDWLDLNSKQEGIRLVGIKYQKCYDWLDLNSKQEGVQLVVFKYQMADDWLDCYVNEHYLKYFYLLKHMLVVYGDSSISI